MKKVAIIPARGGSKRLARKNTRLLLKKPLLAYPVEAAARSGIFDRVIVSTEDREIADAARLAGAEVFKRSNELATDTTRVVQVCRDVLERLRTEGVAPDAFCCIYATAFFVSADDLEKSFRMLIERPPADYVMGVSDYNVQPFQALKKTGAFLESFWPEYVSRQSQENPELTASNGSLYWARVSAFEKSGTFYGQNLKGYFIPKERAIDINTPEDFRLAEILAPHILGRAG